MAVVGGVQTYFSVQLKPKPSLTTTIIRNAKEPQNIWVVTSLLAEIYIFTCLVMSPVNLIMESSSLKVQSAHASLRSC